MILVPAIDILDGRAVRLKKGDYAQVTVYNEDAVAQARLFENAGAQRIHIVDLDGARDGAPTNIDVISRIARETNVEIEIGGGIRSMETLERYLDAGATRLVLGSALVRDPAFCEAAVAAHADNVVAGIDAKDGMVAIEGWREGTSTPAVDLVAELRTGVFTNSSTPTSRAMACRRASMRLPTDGSRRSRAFRSRHPVVLPRWRTSMRSELPAGSIDGVITGRAIYEGAFTVEDGIAACEEASARC